jgi:hypothetical protein
LCISGERRVAGQIQQRARGDRGVRDELAVVQRQIGKGHDGGVEAVLFVVFCTPAKTPEERRPRGQGSCKSGEKEADEKGESSVTSERERGSRMSGSEEPLGGLRGAREGARARERERPRYEGEKEN